jgi:hypothetical protein
VAGHRALEVRHRVVHARQVAVFGPACRKPPRGFEQLAHHVVVTAMTPVELDEASELHAPRIHAPPRCDKRCTSLKHCYMACY